MRASKPPTSQVKSTGTSRVPPAGQYRVAELHREEIVVDVEAPPQVGVPIALLATPVPTKTFFPRA
ncbi:MAG TPA: hypothetical protein VE911_02470, partial [Candidatus Nitrosopolaris sp.]|nr:hypothetical protein [Candidatus Nitrosopolaris sp.]